MPALPDLLAEVRACTRCAAVLPLGPRPVLQLHPAARLLIAAQAPGRKVHASGVPFDDASGERLRDWLGVTRAAFYDPRRFAIVPIGLCYPGRGTSGDRPPRPECAPAWRNALLAQLPRIELTLAVGRHAQGWHRRQHPPMPRAPVLALPHPSPRNNGWLKRHPEFERVQLPLLRERVARILAPLEGDTPPSPPLIRTPRLALRPFSLEDAPFIVELLTSPGWLRFIGDRGVRSVEDARRYLRDGPWAMQAAEGFALWALERGDDGTLLGMCGLLRRPGLDDVELGYALLPAHEGRGYAREAAAAVLQWGFGRRGLRRIAAITHPDNATSVRVLEASGMRFERRLRLPGRNEDSLMYATCADSWPSERRGADSAGPLA